MQPFPQLLNLLLFVFAGVAVLAALRMLYGPRSSHDPLFKGLRLAGIALIVFALVGVFVGMAQFASLAMIPIAVVVIIGTYVRLRRGADRALLSGIAASAEAGVPLDETVKAFVAERGGGRTERVDQALAAGKPLREALHAGGVYVPSEAAAMLATAEARGNLGPLLRESLLPMRSLEGSYMGAANRLLMCLCVGWVWLNITVFIMLKIMPVFDKMFEEFGLKLPAPTVLVINASRWTVSYLSPLFFLLPIASIVFLFWVAARQAGFHVFAWRPFTWLRRRFDGAVILHALSAGLKSQVPLPQLLRAIADRYTIAAVRRRLARVATNTEAGRDPWDELYRAGYLRYGEAASLRAAEKCGNLPLVADELSAAILRRQEYRLQFWAGVLYPILLAIMSFCVLMIVVAVFLPLISLVQGLSGGG